MVNGKPTIISLFAGCGGSSLGYKWAGYHELLAIDFEKNAVDTFRLNFPEVPCWQRDVREVMGQEILEACNLKKGELDLLDASPPCQGFSTAGKRKVVDPRNDLFLEFVRLIKELKPKVFIMENVSGLIKGKMKGCFIEIMKELKSLSYQVRCKLLNAMYYGVPQSRQRLIWMGAREDLQQEIDFPEACRKIISIKEAIGKDGFIEYRHNYSKGKVHFKRSSFKKPCLTITKSGLGWKVYYDTLGQFAKREVSLNKVLPTITKGNRHHMRIGESKESSRLFTIEEALVLSSYPHDWKMIGSFNDRWAKIGNSVPPKFMQAIAESIKQQVFDKTTVEHG